MANKLFDSIKPPDQVKKDVLEVLDYAYKARRDIEIKIEQPEFTSVCPISGLPDFGLLTIRYVPKERIVELKSLKYYLMQYRGVGIFYEHVVNRVLDDLVAVLDPKFLEVTGVFTPRGGITTRVQVTYGAKQSS
ncbi:MAG: NADPH-dependent 7-cyano-7-deazaguanine reductase QueF [Deltaproteobacteria bacterium]|nr:NADPH-dependent 7-cyano-7-deazaguanine reductase QueF [Deltaproteobacteria bacterium]